MGSATHEAEPNQNRFNAIIEDNKVLSQNNVQLTQQVALLRRSLGQQQKSIAEGQDTTETMSQTRALMAALASDVEEMRFVSVHVYSSSLSSCGLSHVFSN